MTQVRKCDEPCRSEPDSRGDDCELRGDRCAAASARKPLHELRELLTQRSRKQCNAGERFAKLMSRAKEK
jgi:hypothetical protein